MFNVESLMICCFIFLFSSCNKNEINNSISYSTKIIDKTDAEYIAILGDIQYYTLDYSTISIYTTTLDWIRYQNNNGVKFRSIIQTGDITHNSLFEQFTFFKNATNDIASEIPFFSMIGDHDYFWDDSYIISRDSTYFSCFLNFPLSVSRIEACFEPNRLENVVYKLIIHNKIYYLLSLEFGPRTEVVEWANAFIKSHCYSNFIIMTHEYLESDGLRRSDNLKSLRRLKNTSVTTPDDLWKNLICCNNNIMCVLCGHVGSLYSVSYDKNDNGRYIPQIQHNIQSSQFRHDNLLMLWKFPNNSDSVNVSIINTKTGKYYKNEILFTFRYR